ncbi:MAG: heme exporter protein CcmB [Hyphomicrobiales bacterium]|nr:heme exporter protein CcmB [Hyphomicrobiales bacterium]
MKAFAALLSREFGGSQLGAGGLGVLFFLAVVVLLPLGTGPDADVLARIAPGILWIAALLASLLGLESMFREDFETGSLEVMAMSALPLEVVVLAKCLAHWLACLLPLAALSVPCGLLLHLSVNESLNVAIAMLLGTPAFSLFGSIGAALTLDARRGGLLALLLVLPLSMPPLIFGSLASGSEGNVPSLLLGAGLSLGALAVAPFLSSAILWARLRA